MRFLKQLELAFFRPRSPAPSPARDPELEALARDCMQRAGAETVANLVRVEWNARMRTAAGRADYRRRLVTLNPRLREHGADEIDRTLRHELAHLLAHFRAGRRRIAPHGPEWRRACADLGIAGEARCHTLPLAASRPRQRRYLYVCPSCRKDFPRVRALQRASACLACCRAKNGGRYDVRFRLALVNKPPTRSVTALATQP